MQRRVARIAALVQCSHLNRSSGAPSNLAFPLDSTTRPQIPLAPRERSKKKAPPASGARGFFRDPAPMVVLDDDAVTCVGQSTGKDGIGRTAGLRWKPERKPADLLVITRAGCPARPLSNASKATKVIPVYVAHSLCFRRFLIKEPAIARLALVRAHHSTARGSARGPSPLATSAEAVIHLFARSPISPTALAKFFIAGIPALIASNKPVLQFWR
jgi:hypothetical protein